MHIEVSTINFLLGLIIGMQVWMVRELFRLRTEIAVIKAHMGCHFKQEEPSNE
jgi:hypothetical protein